MSNFIKIIFSNYSLTQAIVSELEEDIGFFVRPWPGILGFAIRYATYKLLFGHIASMPFIFPGVRFVYMRNIRLGRGVLFNSNSYIYGKGGLEIGDKTLISPNCAIVAGDHNTALDKPIIEQASKAEKIIIGSGCWIGANSVVVGGVTIGDLVVVGAGAVVTKNCDALGIYAGVPAKKIGERR